MALQQRGAINIDDGYDDKREQLIEELSDAHNALALFDKKQGISSYSNAINNRLHQSIYNSSTPLGNLTDANVIRKL